MYRENFELSQVHNSSESENKDRELMALYESLKASREEQKRILREIRNNFKEQKESNPFETEDATPQDPEHMKRVVAEMQDIFIGGAEKYLPENSTLKNDIIRFYSDPERLYTELSNVFRNQSSDTINATLQKSREYFSDKDRFIKYVISKDYSVAN